MESDLFTQAGASGGVIAVLLLLYRILRHVNGRKFVSDCCGRRLTLGVRVDAMNTPPASPPLSAPVPSLRLAAPPRAERAKPAALDQLNAYAKARKDDQAAESAHAEASGIATQVRLPAFLFDYGDSSDESDSPDNVQIMIAQDVARDEARVPACGSPTSPPALASVVPVERPPTPIPPPLDIPIITAQQQQQSEPCV